MAGSRPTSLLWSMVIIVALAPWSTGTSAAGATRRYDIESQPLGDALVDFAGQSDMQIIFFSHVVEGKTSPAVHGRYTITEALDKLLEETGLTYRVINRTTIEIRAPEAAGEAHQEAARRAVPSWCSSAPHHAPALV